MSVQFTTVSLSSGCHHNIPGGLTVSQIIENRQQAGRFIGKTSKTAPEYFNPLTPWKYKAGVEMTFQKKVKTINGLRRWIDYGHYLDVIFLRDKGLNAGYDPYCIEAPTRILKSWGHAKQEIDKALKAAKERKLIAKNKGVSTGGGGHVHVSGMKTLVKIAIQRDMQNRPYVPWFFADPDTTTQCNSADVDDHINCCWYTALNASWDKVAKNPRRYCFQTDKFIHTHLHGGYKTVEFRFFDCFMSWEQYEESLAFAQAYCKWIEKKVGHGKKFPVKIKNRRDVLKQYNDYDKCLKEFKKLIADIGLPWNRYKKYVANLNERFTDESLLT